MVSPLRVNGRDLKPHKAMVEPRLDARTVLTRSPWEFVSLWLMREQKRAALHYWNQARRFADAAAGMPLEASPLVHYYSFMNAAKALLAAKRVSFNEHHGVKAHNMRDASKKIALSNEGVRILKSGIVASLSEYLGDTEASVTHSLKDLLFNLPFVHRTYCLTYRSQLDLFLTLRNARYVLDTDTKAAYLEATLSDDFASKNYLARLPKSFVTDPARPKDACAVRSTESVSLTHRTLRSTSDIAKIKRLHQIIRRDLQYINATQTLWYIKGVVAGPPNLRRSPLTLTIAAMHRLSELCRYRPIQFESFLGGQRNWLLSEFVLMAPNQFLDGIAAEVTGHQFMLPNVRPPT